MSDYKFKMFDHSPPTAKEWYESHPECLDHLYDDSNSGMVNFIETSSIHRLLAGGPVTNVWATLFFLYAGLTVWINVFPEWSPSWMLGGF